MVSDGIDLAELLLDLILVEPEGCTEGEAHEASDSSIIVRTKILEQPVNFLALAIKTA